MKIDFAVAFVSILDNRSSLHETAFKFLNVACACCVLISAKYFSCFKFFFFLSRFLTSYNRYILLIFRKFGINEEWILCIWKQWQGFNIVTVFKYIELETCWFLKWYKKKEKNEWIYCLFLKFSKIEMFNYSYFEMCQYS